AHYNTPPSHNPFSILMRPRPLTSSLFPYTSSSDLSIHPRLCWQRRWKDEKASGSSCESSSSNNSTNYSANSAKPRFRCTFFIKRSEEHTSELQSRENLVCRLLLEKKKIKNITSHT